MSCFFSSRFLFSAGGPAAITVASYCVSVALGVLIDRPESSGVMFGHRMTLPTRFASILRPITQLLSSTEASLLKAKFRSIRFWADVHFFEKLKLPDDELVSPKWLGVRVVDDVSNFFRFQKKNDDFFIDRGKIALRFECT